MSLQTLWLARRLPNTDNPAEPTGLNMEISKLHPGESGSVKNARV